MSAATANIVASSGDTIVFTFTPQAEGYASLSGAHLKDSSGRVTKFNSVVSNQVTFKLPKGNSLLTLAYLDGPSPETWNLSYTANNGVDKVLWSGVSSQTAPTAITAFGT